MLYINMSFSYFVSKHCVFGCVLSAYKMKMIFIDFDTANTVYITSATFCLYIITVFFCFFLFLFAL